MAAAVASDPVLQGLIQIEVYDDAALGDEMACLRGCLDGTIDMAVVSTASGSGLVPEIGLLDAPFLFRSAAVARAVLDGPVGAEFVEVLRSHGINLLAWAENGLRHMTANRPIRRPADLTGLKLRVPPSEVELVSFRALGADAKPMAFSALYEALRTGEFDAQENPIGIIEAARLFEVQKFLSLTTHIYSANMILVAQDLLIDLDPAQRAALTECARRGALETRKAAEAAQVEGVARLRVAGMSVVEDVDSSAFLAASKPVLSAIGAKYGAALLDRLVQAGA